MGPINYSLGGSVDPSQSLMQGFGQGMQLNQIQMQRQAQAAAQQQAQAMQMELTQLAANPRATSADYARTMTRYPQLSEQLKRASDTLNADQQQQALSHSSQVFAALRSGRGDLAANILTERADLMESSGQGEQAQQARSLAELAKTQPQMALAALAPLIASLPGGDKVLDGVAKYGGEVRAEAKAPAELRTAEAGASTAESQAKTAAVTAKYADSQALADLETKGWNVKALQADIEFKRQSTRIAAMNAALAREGNDLKREELRMKLDDAKRTRDDKVREKVATAEAGASAIDNMLNTIERIKKSPGLRDVVGSFEGSDLYPTQAMAVVGAGNPYSSSGDDRADAIALVETLGSQAFLAQIPSIKGMGALSNAEGDKLQAALQNLKRKQSEKQFDANLAEAARILTKGRESLARSTGVPLGSPDTPAAPSARPPLESFMR